MERVIYKFELPRKGTATHMGFFRKLLQAQVQNERVVVWAEIEVLEEKDGIRVPKELKNVKRITFTCIPTGQPYESNGVGEYFDTVQIDGHATHIFVNWEN